MVITFGKLSQLPAEPLAAGVVGARRTPAVAAPVAERFGELAEERAIGQDSASLPPSSGDCAG